MAYAPPAGFVEYIQDYLPGGAHRVNRQAQPSSTHLVGSLETERDVVDDVQACLDYQEEQV